MEILKILIIIGALFFSAILQTSFLVPFNLPWITFNLIFVLVLIINLFEDAKSISGYFAAGIGGFFLDIFSNGLIGYNTIILLLMAVFIKLVFKEHVRIPFLEKN